MQGDTLGPQARRTYEALHARIVSGSLPAGTKLPPQNVLARKLGVAAMTLRQALARLEAEELIVSEQGRGTYVGAAPSVPVHLALPPLDMQAERYRRLVEACPDAMLLVGLDGKIVMCNQRAAELHGYASPDDLRMRAGGELVHPKYRERARANVQACLEGEDLGVIEYPLQHKDGRVVPAELTVSLVRDPSGAPEAMSVVVRDVSFRKPVDSTAGDQVHRIGQVIEGIRVGVVVVGASGQILTCNPAFQAMFGIHGSVTGMGTVFSPSWTIIHEDGTRSRPEESAAARALLTGQPVLGVVIGVDSPETGELRWFVEDAVPQHSNRGSVDHVILTFTDITDRKRAEESLRHQALHDPLTDLPNRTMLHDRLQHALSRASRDGERHALLLLDLDRFKEVNDVLGHEEGDRLLQQVAARLSAVTRDADTVARLGGDEFAFLLEGTDVEQGIAVATRVLAQFENPFQLGGQSVYLGASLGIAVHPEHGTQPSDLLRHADVAMYATKHAGGGYRVYETQIDPRSRNQFALATDLRDAIAHGGLTLLYQPKIDLEMGGASQVEALVRWPHPTRGPIPPDEFVELAERTGLIRPLTSWVLREAVRQAAAWRDQGQEVQVAVNLSAANLHDAKLVDSIRRLLHEMRVDPTQLQLEITESALVQDPAHARVTLTQLHEMGVTLSIDDFGTGYSSLAYLQNLPVDEVKIDRSFVLAMMQDVEESFVIVRSVIDLGHNLGLDVVAEGVETQYNADVLAAMGCDYAQGYHYCRPIPADDYTRWLSARAREEPALQSVSTPSHDG